MSEEKVKRPSVRTTRINKILEKEKSLGAGPFFKHLLHEVKRYVLTFCGIFYVILLVVDWRFLLEWYLHVFILLTAVFVGLMRVCLARLVYK